MGLPLAWAVAEGFEGDDVLWLAPSESLQKLRSEADLCIQQVPTG